MLASASCLRFLIIAVMVHLSGCTVHEMPQNQAPAIQQPRSPVTTVTSLISEPINKPIKVALLLPLSHEHSDIGKALQQSAELALFQNQQAPLQLIMKDTQGQPEGARRAATAALNENVDIILGPLLAAEVTAVSSIIQKRIPLLAFSNNQAVAQQNVFVLGHNPAEQVSRILRYAASRGIYDIILVTSNNDYGTVVNDIASKLNAQGVIRIIERMPSDPVLLAERLMKFGHLQGKGLLIAEDAHKSTHIIQRLKARGIDLSGVTLLGTSLWNTPDIIMNSHFQGAFFSACDNHQQLSFEQLYERTYGDKPAKIASLAYDALGLITALYTQRLTTAESVSNNSRQFFDIKKLIQEHGFTGIDGFFRLQKDGHVERHYAVYEIDKGTSSIIDNVPSSL